MDEPTIAIAGTARKRNSSFGMSPREPEPGGNRQTEGNELASELEGKYGAGRFKAAKPPYGTGAYPALRGKVSSAQSMRTAN